MPKYLVQRAAGLRLDNIYRYTKDAWGKKQADKYIRGLFDQFEAISDNTARSHPIPAEFNVEGFVSRYEHHLIYWKKNKSGKVLIVTVLHERMHQIERFKDDFKVA